MLLFFNEIDHWWRETRSLLLFICVRNQRPTKRIPCKLNGREWTGRVVTELLSGVWLKVSREL